MQGFVCVWPALDQEIDFTKHNSKLSFFFTVTPTTLWSYSLNSFLLSRKTSPYPKSYHPRHIHKYLHAHIYCTFKGFSVSVITPLSSGTEGQEGEDRDRDEGGFCTAYGNFQELQNSSSSEFHVCL